MMEHEEAAAAKPELRDARRRLEERLAGIEGAQLEPKAVALAVHYRRVDEARAGEVVEAVEALADEMPHLKATRGKKVVELRPDVAWDKGRALRWVLDQISGDAQGVVPVYVGDDLTDEDAFREIAGDGISALVGDHGEPSRAHYRLEDPDQVRALIWKLASLPAPERRRTTDRTAWSLVYDEYRLEQQPLREALCTLGNGYFATRGAAEEEHAGGAHYPGTYLAGGYDRRETYLAERWIENEDLVNWPNWLHLTFRPEGGEWLSLDDVEVLRFRQELDLRRGVLERHVRVRDRSDRETELISRRLVHMRQPHLAAEHWRLIPRNWSGRVHLRSLIDGSVINAGVARYRDLEGRHHEVVGCGAAGEDVVHLTVRTLQSKIRMSQAARTRVSVLGQPAALERERFEGEGRIGQSLGLEAELGREIEIEKVAAIYTIRDHAIADPLTEAISDAEHAPDFETLRRSHELAWKQLWSRWDMRLGGERHPAQGILRLHLFHLLQSVSPHSIDLDVGVTSRGLHGEAYRGHVFWDEIFIFPIINLRMPEITRALLMYRYRRLDEARRAAHDAGYRGAMYPWQSGSNGREESQELHLNPESGRWIPDETHLQRHVNAAIAYNVWLYFEATCDHELLSFYGAEMILEIAEFFASLATYDADSGRYHICGVVGPDEFHTRYPDRDEPGLRDNAYTNIMAAWVLRTAGRALERITDDRAAELLEALGMTHDDVQRFHDVSRRMYVPFLDEEKRLIAQFEGYGDLEELDWEAYRKKYGNIQRLDRILEAEGDTVNRYKASKQADVLMLFYLFSTEELQSLFEHLGYAFDGEMIPENIDYYSGRTSYGSSLSRIVYAWVLARSDRERSWSLFEQALRSDVEDIQGGTTPEGIHLGAMAGTVDLVQRCYGGIETRDDVLWLNPRLPMELPRVDLSVRYRGSWLDLRMTHRELHVSLRCGTGGAVDVGVRSEITRLEPGQRRTFTLE
jgi:alpha,alpha-trehalase